MNSLNWLTQLVSFDTTSHHSNMALIEYIEAYFKKLNVPYFISKSKKEKKANIFATLKNTNNAGGLILSGHTDVVPVADQIWNSDPFAAVEKNGKIYGRGTADMKGFIAVLLALLPEFLKMNLQKPLHFAFTYDEEVGCKGIQQLLRDLENKEITASACIVGEPSEMRAVVAHKGLQMFQCRVKGLAAHSSLTPHGCNAIDFAAALIAFIRRFADEIRITGPFDKHFDVPFTTITTNLIKGGTATNIIPEMCEFTFEFRHLPEVDPDRIISKIKHFIKNELQPQMKKEFGGAEIELKIKGAVPAFECNADELKKWIQQWSEQTEIRKVAYATEAGFFQKVRIPTIICGPGSIEQAHRANEYIEKKQLETCEKFLREFVKGYCTSVR